MKKQESGKKKNLKWILLAAALLVLAAAIIVVCVVLGNSDQEATEPQNETTEQLATEPADTAEQEFKLYWNVDQSRYVAGGLNGNTGRLPRADGYYYIRFAVDGEQVDIPVEDINLVNRIDMLKVMSLELDEDGVVVDVFTLNECTGGTVAPSLYVESVDGFNVVGNTQGTYRGVSISFTLNENTKIYRAESEGPLVGVPWTINADDEIIAIQDYDGNISHVYVIPYEAPGDVYWNLVRKYDSTNQMTTRTLDATGCYVFEMALNGEVVTVRTRNQSVANSIDSRAAMCMSLTFDDEGYAISVGAPSLAGCPSTCGSWVRVLEVDSKSIHSKKMSGSSAGAEYYGVISENCKIIDVSAVGGYSGAYTEVRYGDLVHCLTDNRGRVAYIFVINRLGEYNLYWNVERKYDSTNGVTTRVPANDGYYYIPVATGGEQITVKTKDVELASKLDSYAARCFGMTLTEDNEIIAFYGADSIHGGSTFGSWYLVDELDGDKIVVKRVLSGDTEPTYQEGVLSKDVEIINGSTNFTNYCGEYSTLSVGDRVHCLKDLNGEIRVVFIVTKPVDSPVYWNISRRYDSTNAVSTRKRADDGYFYFTMAVNGKQVKLKTADQEIANQVDEVAAKCMGLTVVGDTIVKKHVVTNIRNLGGGTKSMSWVDVISINGRSFTAQKNSTGHAQDGMQFTSTMASDCVVYNVSSGYTKICGEKTTLRVGDRVHVLHDNDGYAKVIFVVSGRDKELDTEPNTCPCEQGVTWEAWDGTTELKDGKYYYLTKDVVAPTEGFVIENMAVNLRLDGHTISSDGRCFFVKSGGQLSICDHNTRGKLVGTGVTGESGGVIRMYTEGNDAKINIWNIDIVNDNTDDAIPKEGGALSASGPVTLHNVNVYGGQSTTKGGNILINPTGVVRMFGGTVSGGTSGTGGNIYVNNGSMYLEGVTVSDGQSNGRTDNMYISSEKQMKINGLTVTNSDKKGSGVYFNKGSLGVAGKIDISNNPQINMYMGPDAIMTNDGLDASSKIYISAGEQDILTGATSSLKSAIISEDPTDYVVVYNNGTISLDCVIEPKPHTKNHCVCAGGASGLGDHTCSTLSGWTLITDDVFETVVGINGNTEGVKFKKDGNYYLTLDYALKGQLCIMPGQNITICLNGNDLTRSGNRVFMIGGTLNVTDCYGGGTVEGSAGGNGVTAKLVSGGVLNLYAGTMTSDGNFASNGGGVVAVSQDKGNIVPADSTETSVFNMYGGTVTGGCGTVGGNILMWHTTTFNMYGGTVSRGEATNGGNLGVNTSTATVNLLGGTVTGGTASEAGGGIYSKSDLTVGGKMNISGNTGTDIYLTGTKTVTLKDYTNTAKTVIGMSNPGTFAKSEKDLSAYFSSADSAYTVAYMGTSLYLDAKNKTHESHCICGGVEGHDCGPVNWQPWDGTTALTSGSWYLTQDVEFTQVFEVGTKSINICLNGYKIYSNSDRLFRMNSTGGVLNIGDCTGTGALESVGNADGNGGGLIRHGTAGAYVGLYNITLRRTDTGTRTQVKEGGVMSCSGYLDMINVTMENGYAQKAGNLLVAYTAQVTMKNCTLRNGTAYSGNGGNIMMTCTGGSGTTKVTGTLTMTDVTVTGGEAKTTGDGLYLAGAYNELYLGGDVRITGNTADDLYMASTGNLHVLDSGLADTASIGITMATAGLMGNSAVDASGAFESSNTNYEIIYDAVAKTLTLGVPVLEEKAHSSSTHCVCNGASQGVGDHTCETLTEWTVITDDVFEAAIGTDGKTKGVKFISDGNYYLPHDYFLTGAICIMPGQNITVCLNGSNLVNTSGRVFLVAGSLKLTDCEGTGIVKAGETYNGGCKLVCGGNMEMYAGTLTNTKTTSTGGSSLVVSQDNGSITSAKDVSVFTMYGGAIVDGSSTTNGGNVTVWHSAQFIMYGGTISGGTTTANGGNLSVNGKEAMVIKLLGGEIIGGTAGGNGNAIYAKVAQVTIGGSFKLTDGDIYLDSSLSFTVQDWNVTDPVTVTVGAQGVFATNVTDPALKDMFRSGNSEYAVVYDSSAKTLALMDPTVQLHQHCVCSGTADHGCDELIWQAWDGTTALTAGNWYLTQDVEFSSVFNVGTNTVNICLNGYKIYSNSDRLFRMNSAGGVLNIGDCTGTGALESVGNADGNGGGLIRHGTSSAYVGLYNITLRRTDTGTRTQVKEGGVMSCSGYLDMVNVTMENGYAEKAGNLLVAYTAQVTMKNCTFRNGTAYSGNGGNIMMVCSGGSGTTKVTGTLTMTDVTVTGGSAKTAGDGLYLAGTYNELYLGGNIQITGNGDQNLYMTITNNLFILDEGLDAASSIGVYMVNKGVITTCEDDYSQQFFSDDKNYMITYKTDSNTLVMEENTNVTHEAHCVCGGSAAGVGDHACETVTEWTEITDDVFTLDGKYLTFQENGCYYLTGDYTLPDLNGTSTDQTIAILPGQDITICLNGYTMISPNRMFRVNGILNITDCDDSGKLIGTSALAPVFYGYSGGHINLYAGELSSGYTGTASYWGGVGALAKDAGAASAQGGCSMTMYGGTIVAGNVVKNSSGGFGTGAGIAIMGNATMPCTFIMYGGQITGGSAEVGGAAIHTDGGNTVSLLGGVITGGTSPKGQINVSNKTVQLTVGGSVQVADIYLANDARVILSSDKALTDTARIGVTMQSTTGVFAEDVEAVPENCFFGAQSGMEVEYSQTDKTLSLVLGGHSHCVCGGSAEGVGDHVQCEAMGWTPISEALEEAGMTLATADFGKLSSGNYYLDGDVTVTGKTWIGGTGGANATHEVDLNICLNGYDISTTLDNVFFRLYEECSISVCDCSGEQDEDGNWTWGGTVTGGTGGNGQIIYTYEKATMNIYGGNFTGKENVTASGYGLFCIAMDKGESSNPVENATVMNLYNGRIHDNSTSGKGAHIVLMHASILNMYGGMVTGGSATDGGNIVIGNSATANILGGTVSNGTATGTGSDICVTKNTAGTAIGTLILGGDVQIGEVYLVEGAVIEQSTEVPLTEDARVGVKMATADVFATVINTALDYTKIFSSTDTLKQVTQDGENLKLTDA